MSRWLFPQDRTVLLYTRPLQPILETPPVSFEIFDDPDCLILADLADTEYGVIPNATVTTEDDGLLPLFYGTDGLTTLYLRRVGSQVVHPIEALYGPRIAALMGPTSGNTSILNGHGAPSGVQGVEGDFYLDLDSYALWGPKTPSGWPVSGHSLVGPAGQSINVRIETVPPTPLDAGGNGDFWVVAP